MSLVDLIHKKQEEGQNIEVYFRNSPSTYIKPESHVEMIDEDFIYIISDTPYDINDIFNIKDFMRIRIIKNGDSDVNV